MAKARSVQPKMRGTAGAANISVHDFTEAVFTGVLRALDARKPKLSGKIIYGIVLDPTLARLEAGGLIERGG